MKDQIKCKNCGSWNDWNKDLSERCKDCGEILAKEEVKKIALRKKLQVKEAPFKIHDGDGLFLRIVKHIGKAGYVTIMAVVSFILTILFWLPG